MVDAAPPEGEPAPWEAAAIVRSELAAFSPALAEKPVLVAANKMDLTGAEESLEKLARETGETVLPISAVTGKGLKDLVEAVWRALNPEE